MTSDLEPSTTVGARLSTLDRWLPLWIGLAMVGGLLLGAVFPDIGDTIGKVKIDTVSLPIAIGLLVMMYPVLAKVRYGKVREEVGDVRPITLTLFFNWVIGPLLMFSLAWIFLSDLPQLRTGLVIVGIAPCIAMVLIWNDLAYGNREMAAALVAVNALIQIVAFSAFAWFYLSVLPGWFGFDQSGIDVSAWEIARSVLIFLGIPLLAGYVTRKVGEGRKGTEWYEQRFLPRIGPVALYGLLFTIVCLFAMQGKQITDKPLDVVRVALPLLVYFSVMWGLALFASYRLRFSYDRAVTVAFTSAGNNFELSIAVCIAVFGITSGEALAGTIGPLIEVPVLIGLVYVALWARRRFRFVGD
jgi:ACR3 family arsenite transporter